MPELTKEELAALLKKVDEVCHQAQQLSAEIRKKMAVARRTDQRLDTSDDRPRRAARRKR